MKSSMQRWAQPTKHCLYQRGAVKKKQRAPGGSEKKQYHWLFGNWAFPKCQHWQNDRCNFLDLGNIQDFFHLWPFSTAPLFVLKTPKFTHTHNGKVIQTRQFYNHTSWCQKMNVLGNFCQKIVICVAFICLTNCYRGSDLKSKYVIGVMWCLSNMWTVFFVRNNWRKRRRRSRRRITSYCGKFCSNYFVLFSICLLFVLQFQNVSLSLRQIGKTQNIAEFNVSHLFFSPSLSTWCCVKYDHQETVRMFGRCISVHRNLNLHAIKDVCMDS